MCFGYYYRPEPKKLDLIESRVALKIKQDTIDSAEGMYGIGRALHRSGEFMEAIKIYEAFADQSVSHTESFGAVAIMTSAAAINNLAVLLYQGLDTPVNKERALELWERASEWGYTLAKANLVLVKMGLEEKIKADIDPILKPDWLTQALPLPQL